MLFVRAYPRETQEMVFDAHDRAVALFKGTCRRGICDNMRTAVETIFVGKDRLYNRRFQQMCSHHLVDPVACMLSSGWESTAVVGSASWPRTGVRKDARTEGRKACLEENFFTEKMLFDFGIIRRLAEKEKAYYRAPYAEPGVSRLPHLPGFNGRSKLESAHAGSIRGGLGRPLLRTRK
jgi:hypothetical protein